MSATVDSDMMRRAGVIGEVCSLLNRLDRTQADAGLPPLEAVSASTDAGRLEHVEALVRNLRRSLYTAGEVSTPVLIALGAQAVAWAASADERDACRIQSGEEA